MEIKQLVQHILKNKNAIEKLEDISTYFPDNVFNKVEINSWIEVFKTNSPSITIDARSPSEFEIDHLPQAINFPILNNQERKEVGFLYKNFSPEAALFRAKEIAKNKKKEIKAFTKKILSQNKQIFVYCWRGGKRSSALIHFMKDNGANPSKIIGGYKAYRNQIYNLFYNTPEKLDFVPLIGMTGCGKTKIIEDLTEEIPVFDIEKAASHASSLFGKIRYNLKNSKDILTQTKFENLLYTQTITASKANNLPFLTEGESKKINKFEIPGALFQRLIKSPAIKITASIETRTSRIKEEYFNGKGAEKVYEVVKTSNFLLKILGKEKKNYLLSLIEQNKHEEFSKWFLENYYDKRYASKYQNIIAEVNADNLTEAKQEILAIIKKIDIKNKLL